MELKRVGIIVVLFVVIGLAMVKMRQGGVLRKENHLCTIGILQTASHPALDAVREGFVAAIQEKVGDRIDFVVRNGQGSISTIYTIAQQFHAKDNIDGIFAIATPAAQAIISVEKEKPVGLAAVSVTPALRDVMSGHTLYGVSDMINVRSEVEALRTLLPESKTIGILYCTAEINSVAMVDIMVIELKNKGFDPLLIGVTSEADIAPALISALRKIDAIITPTDNVVANAIALIADVMNKAQKPLIVSDNMLVKNGALMARGVDYHESGRQAGLMTLEIFVDGKKPHELSIVPADNKEIFINKQVADSLGITIPDVIMHDVVLV